MTFSEIDYCKDPLSVDTRKVDTPTLNYLNYKCQQRMRLKNKGLKLSQKRASDSKLLTAQGDENKTGFENEVVECYENINNGFLDLKHLNPNFWNTFTDVPSYLLEGLKGDWDLAKAAGKFMGNMIPMMITAIFTEEGAIMIAEGIATEKAARMLINYTFKSIAKASAAITKELGIESVQKGAEAASRYFFTFTESIITRNFTNVMKIVKYGVQEAVEEGALIEGEAVVAAACPPCACIIALLDAVILIGMVMDMLDPFGCATGAEAVKSFNATALNQYQTSWNTGFADSILASVMPNIQMENGTVIGRRHNQWPIEYDASQLFESYSDNIPIDDDTLRQTSLWNPDLSADKQSWNDPDLSPTDPESVRPNWEDVYNSFLEMYIDTLQVNVYGQTIIRETEENWDDTYYFDPLDPGIKFHGNFALKVSNQNTVTAQWVYQWWPLLFLAFIILIFVIIKLL